MRRPMVDLPMEPIHPLVSSPRQTWMMVFEECLDNSIIRDNIMSSFTRPGLCIYDQSIALRPIGV